MRAEETAVILCSIHNAHATRRQDLRKPQDFDAYARAKAKADAKKFREENNQDESISDFILRHTKNKR